MFQKVNCELISKTRKEPDGISYELLYVMDVSKEEKDKLKHFRENFAKTSPLHFHFNDDKFSFSQKKYYKKSQFIETPPDLIELETSFLEEVKHTFKRFNNLIQFEKTEDIEVTKKIDLKELMK